MIENALAPIYTLMGYILSGFYALVPNYGLAIMGTTLVVLIVLTPLTLKQIRQGIRMQKLQPDIKRIQDEHKDDPQAKNEAVMALYKEHNANPISCILPMLVQFPFFIALNGILSGMSAVSYFGPDGSKVEKVKSVAEAQAKLQITEGVRVVGTPRHLPDGSSLYKSLAGDEAQLGHLPGQMKAFGMDLAKAAKDVTSDGFSALFPYMVVITLSIVAGVYAQSQITKRNPAASAANPQQQTIAKVMPFLFGIWGFVFQGGLAVYFTTQSVLRIGQQSLLFRFDPTLAESVRENRQKALAEGIIDVKAKQSKVARTAPVEGKGQNGAAKGPKGATAAPKGGAGARARATGAASTLTTAPPPARSGASAPRPVGRQQPKKKRKGR